MQDTKTRSSYGDVSRDELKIKHIESMAEAVVTVTATSSEELDTIDLKDIGYDTIRGPLKTRRELIKTDASPSQLTIQLTGYTCTQWHHSPTEITEFLQHSIEQRLIDTQLKNISVSVSIGDEHDIESLTGGELLTALTQSNAPPK